MVSFLPPIVTEVLIGGLVCVSPIDATRRMEMKTGFMQNSVSRYPAANTTAAP